MNLNAKLFIIATLLFTSLCGAQEPAEAPDYTLYLAEFISRATGDRIPTSQNVKRGWPVRFRRLSLADGSKSTSSKARFLPLTSIDVARRWGSVSQLEPFTSTDLPAEIKAAFVPPIAGATYHLNGVVGHKRDNSVAMAFSSGETENEFSPYYSQFSLLHIGNQAQLREIRLAMSMPSAFSGFVDDERRLGYFATQSLSITGMRAGQVRALNRDGTLETINSVRADVVRASPTEETVALLVGKGNNRASLFLKDQELKKRIWKKSLKMRQKEFLYAEVGILWSEDGNRVCVFELVDTEKRRQDKIMLTVFDAKNGDELRTLELPPDIEAYVLTKTSDEASVAGLLGLELQRTSDSGK